MPFIKRVVTPLYVSRSTDANNFEDNSILTRDNSELIAVNNCTLSNAIRQLASLAGHAEEIFAELRQELGEVNARATSLKQRICHLEVVAEKLDARTVTVPESDLDSFYRRTDHFAKKAEFTTCLFSATTRTPALRRMYEAAGTTPVPAMRELDRLRRDGRRSSRIFMCTPVLGGTGPRRKRRMQLDDIETSKPASLTNIRPWKSSEVLGETTAAPDVSVAPLVDTSALDSTVHQLPSPEEQWSAVARRFPGQVVAVDVSGRSFDRQQRNRRSLSQVDTSRAERHRKRRSRRRNTICGTSEAELIRQAADGESQPGSGDPDSPEIESSIQSLSSKRKITSSDKERGAMGDRVLSHFNSLRQWGRQRLSRSVTRNKEENNIYESVRGRRRSQSTSPHNVSVRLRTNTGRKKEDAAVHSSSGNWSASSSARTSVESDQHRNSSCPPSTSSHATSIPVSSSSSNSLGRDSAVSIRRPKALSVSSSISRTSESGTLTPELLLPHDIPFADSISSSCNDGETSSVYSCDTEGYYTSFHMDSGLKTLREEPLESSSNTANNTNSSSNTTVCAQIVTKALTAENEYELFGKGSTSTTTSSAGTVCTTLLAPGKPSPPPRKSSLEQVSNKSDSNSDNDTIERRLRVKTALSSSRIPSMCVITPPPSDDESMRPSSQLSFHTLPRTNEKSTKVAMAPGNSVNTLHVINNISVTTQNVVVSLTEENIKKINSPPSPREDINALKTTNDVSKTPETKIKKDVCDSPKKSEKVNSSPPLKASLLPFNIVGKMKEVLSNRKSISQITSMTSAINTVAQNNNNTNKNSNLDGDYVTISEVQKHPNIVRDTEYVSLNELPCNSQNNQQNRPISPADSGSGSSSSTKSPQNSLERRRRQGARVTLDSEGKVVYSSDSLKRQPKTSNTTFEPGPYVKADPSPSPLPVRSTAVRPVTRNQQTNNDSPVTSPPMSPSSNRVIIRASGNKATDSIPRATVRASSGPISPKSNHPGAYVDMQASEKKVVQGKKENNLNLAPLTAAQTQEKQPTPDNINVIDPCQELNKIKRNESYRLAANFSSVLQAKQLQQNGETKKQQVKQPPRIAEEKSHQIINPNLLGRRFYGAQIMVDPSKIISSNSNVTSRLQHHELQQHLLASQIAATSPKSRVTIPSDTEKARVLNSDMLPSAAMAGPSSPHHYYMAQRGAMYQFSATNSPLHGGAASSSTQYPGAMSEVSQYRTLSPQHQQYGSISSPPPPAPYYWTLPSRRTTTASVPQVETHQPVPQPSWYHTVAGHNKISSPPCSPMRNLDTNHNVLKNQMFSTPNKNHSPQLPYCSYSPISSPKKIPDRQTSSPSPTLSPSRMGSPSKPILSPPRSTMSAEELFAAIHRSKRRMNIKTNDDFSRSTSPTTSSASLSPGSSESSLGAAGNRHSWSPSSNDLIPEFIKSKEHGSPIRGQQRQSWAGDRLGPVQPTSRNVFKRLLLEKGSRTEGKGRISAVEQLMASKSSVTKPKEQKVMLPTMPSGLRSPASWRFNSPRSDVLSSTIVEDAEDASESPTHSYNSIQQNNISPRHGKYYTPKTPLSPNTSRYNLTPAQASDFAARSNDHNKYLRNDLDRNYALKSEMTQSLNYPNISPIRNHDQYQHLSKYASSSASSPPSPSTRPSPRMASLMSKTENRKPNPVVTQPPSPSKLSLETAL